MALLGLSLVYFLFLQRAAPQILERDRDTSAWYYSSFAQNAWREFEELGDSAPPGQKRDLLQRAAEGWTKAHNLRPDSHDYHWSMAMARYELARMDDPPQPARLTEAVCIMQEVRVKAPPTWPQLDKLTRFLAQHFLDIHAEDQAAALYRELLTKDPSRPEPYSGLVQIAWRKKQTREGIRLLTAKEEHSYLTNGDRLLLAGFALAIEDYLTAARAMSSLVEGGNANKDEWLIYGLASAGVGDLVESVRALKIYQSAVSEGEPWPEPNQIGLERFPASLFPALAWVILEAEVEERETP
jgi:hypothetical protein